MKLNFLTASIITAAFITPAFAGTMGPVTTPEPSFVATLSLGPVWSHNGDTQTLFLTPDIVKTYVANKTTETLLSGELFIGFQRALSAMWNGQFGLAAATTSNAKLKGVIWDDADPRFDNLSYHYKVQHTRLALKGKFLYENNYWVTPWVSASAGVAFNRAHGFTNTPLIFQAEPNPNFTSNTTNDFTYTLGAGVQRALNENWQIGVGYEFADWGKSQLGLARGQSLNTGLTLNHLYTNGVLFTLTYTA